MLTKEQLEELKQLLDKVPKGDWDLGDSYTGSAQTTTLNLIDVDGKTIVETSGTNITLYEINEDHSEGEFSYYRINGPVRHALELCAKAVNLLPAMIEEIESSRKILSK